ncbi:MAG: hypothetical protein H6748_09185 [Spirochaetaceae bacterium]|nr:hypothetical protein [Myxococcales bacterium]MCB9724205.1 hypothetical protein [Spirochaetaceae bacterium]HPG27579.1 hypothetical protein [Myxococcota bacterium]
MSDRDRMAPVADRAPDDDDPQWERANQAWQLWIDVAGRDLPADGRRAMLRVLRVKRSEREALLAALPGIVRKGARVDLEAPTARLREAGIPCRLVRRPDAGRPATLPPASRRPREPETERADATGTHPTDPPNPAPVPDD